MKTKSLLASVDEDCRRRFEQAWRAGQPLPIEDCLPAATAPLFLATLEELVIIDLEFRARNKGSGSPPRLEDYLGRFPALAEPALLHRLLREEWRARRRWGEAPAAEEYGDRFPQLTLPGSLENQTRPNVGGLGAAPLIPGYEVLEELGRGGMGVVYKARQIGLNRVVALKMILSGSQASLEERELFLAEAEAVARFQHPNIVQIYQVAEHQGQSFLALEFVEGGTLAARLAGTPQPGREAAALVETLARAMHYAHARKVVHRDLKPANVLLALDHDPKGIAQAAALPFGSRLDDCVPKITDFGLAKRLDEADSTQSGMLKGTPSYMAPEQALGRARKTGPAVDVYALGAILYEMLTGRPPFKGMNILDTLDQVCHREPVPPRRLQPGVPRDLETICLKCLAKEPARRYESAQGLAEDLRRFQEGQPIRARPSAWPERLVKWVKRRPAVAALAAAVVAVVVAGVVTSLVLAGWAFSERDQARERLKEAQQAEHRRLQAQVEQLGSAAPEAVPDLLVALEAEREAVRPRLDQLWAAGGGDRQRRLRAGLALLDDPSVRGTLADWMIETDDPREVLLVRQVLTRYGAELAERLWHKAADRQLPVGVRFRALVALADFDPANPRWTESAPLVVEQLLKANPLHLGLWLPALRPVRDHLQGMLANVFRGQLPLLADYRHLAATVLAAYAEDRPAVLADLACDADAKQFAVLRPVLEKQGKEVREALAAELTGKSPALEAAASFVSATGQAGGLHNLWQAGWVVERIVKTSAAETDRIARARRQGKAAAALAALGEPGAVWPLLKHSPTPDARSVLIHALGPCGVNPRMLVRRLQEEKDASSRAALILALGEFTAEQLPAEVRAPQTSTLLGWYRNDPDPGVHGAIDWLLRHSKEGPVDRLVDWGARTDLEKIDVELSGKPGRAGQRWYVNGQGQTMVVIPGPVEFWMGAPLAEPDRWTSQEAEHHTRIGRTFALAAKCVTVKQYQRFWKDFSTKKYVYYSKRAPSADCPAHSLDWYMAAAYCNWLSARENIPRTEWCYETNSQGEVTKLKDNYLTKTGYRLPTEAEWEYGCRANVVTGRYFGASEELLGKYAWFVDNAKDRTWPVGSKKPNDLGLFDMHGNVYCWCQESFKDYAKMEADKVFDDVEDELEIKSAAYRMLRGGSIFNHAEYLRSAVRLVVGPTYKNVDLGFRPARTLPRVPD